MSTQPNDSLNPLSSHAGTDPIPKTLADLPTLDEREVWILAPRHSATASPAFDAIFPGSAIVAASRGGNMPLVVVYYEGNLLRAINQHAYLERLVNAWGRLVYRYPTIAMMGLTPEQLLQRYDVIGTYDGTVVSWLEGGQARADEIQGAYERHWARPSVADATAEVAP